MRRAEAVPVSPLSAPNSNSNSKSNSNANLSDVVPSKASVTKSSLPSIIPLACEVSGCAPTHDPGYSRVMLRADVRGCGPAEPRRINDSELAGQSARHRHLLGLRPGGTASVVLRPPAMRALINSAAVVVSGYDSNGILCGESVPPNELHIQQLCKSISVPFPITSDADLIPPRAEFGAPLRTHPFDPMEARRSSHLLQGLTSFPSTARRPTQLHPSVLLQLDGLLYSIVRLRLERDVCAATWESSFCHIFGLARFEAASAFCALFLHDPEVMQLVVDAAVKHRAHGLFVIPDLPDSKVYKQLCANSLRRAPLIFSLPCGSLVPGQPCVAIYASFSVIAGMKSQRRPERAMAVGVVKAFATTDGKIGPRPLVIHQVSPLARDQAPAPADDTAPHAAPAVPFSDACPPVRPMPSRWDRQQFADETQSFPFPDLRDLGLDVVGPGVDTYAGSLDKNVPHPSHRLSDSDAHECRKKLVEARDCPVPKAMGPSPAPFFEFAKDVPPFTVKKDPYDPLSDRRRPVFNFSARAGGPSSNELDIDPHLFRENLRPHHFRDYLCWLLLIFGIVSALAFDVPGAFELNGVCARLLPLMQIPLSTEEYGQEYWLKLATSFGWKPSEWGWQAWLALVLWRLRLISYDQTMAYVDNFYLLLGGEVSLSRHTTRLALFFNRINCPLHEWQFGTKLKVLGWIFDFSNPLDPLMICPLDKWVALCALLKEVVGKPILSLKTVHRLAGVMIWLSSGFSMGTAAVISVVAIRTAGVATQAKMAKKKGLPSVPTSTVKCAISDAAADAISFWHDFFPAWNRECPAILGFGPCASFQLLGRVDAATIEEDPHGCGGFIFDPTLPYILAFHHVWTKEELNAADVVVRKSSTVLESFGARYFFQLFGDICEKKRLLFESDNAAVIYALEKYFSSKHHVAGSVRVIRKIVARFSIVLRARHCIGDVFNQLADFLSHGRLMEARCLAVQEFGSPLRFVDCPAILL